MERRLDRLMDGGSQKGEAAPVRFLRDTLDRLAMRVFYWLRVEGEARNLSPALSQRIVQGLDALLESLATQDFAPTARFLAEEQERVGEMGLPERTLQTLALLDACERTLAEGIQASNHATLEPPVVLNALNTLVHQARRHWVHLCLGQGRPGGDEGKAIGLLAALGHDIETAADLDSLIERLFANLHRLIPHEDGQLLLWGPRQETPLVRCASSHLFVGHGGAVDSYSNWVAFQRTPLLVSDLGAGPESAERPAYNSYIGIPLLQGDHLVGTLALVSTKANAFNQDSLDLLVALSPLLSNAVQRVVPEAGALEDMQRRLEERNILLTFGREITAALEEERIYSLLLYKAMELTDSDAGAVLTVDPGRQEYAIQALCGYASDLTADDALTANPTISWDVGIVGWVARTGQAALIPDVREEKDYLAIRPETRSQMTLPIRWQGEVVGVLNLESSSLNAYSEDHQMTAEMLVDQAAAAIGTTRLFKEIQAQRQWLAGLVANLPEGIVVTDNQMRVILANPASSCFFGLEQPLPAGVDLESFLLGALEPTLQDPEGLVSFLQRMRVLSQGLAEGWLEFKEGGRRLWLVGASLWGENGNPGGHVLLIRDARQEQESEREKLGFISVVSHELRSPLTSILGYSELLLARDFRRERRQDFLRVIFNQAEHLSRLVDDLINLSRHSRGRLQLHWSKATFYQVVSGLATQLNALMSERHFLLMDVPVDSPAFYMDRDKVRAILTNLIGNAVKYSPDGGEVVLQATAVLSSEQAQALGVATAPPCLLVSVRDQGIGIPEEALPHIFDRFYRADNSVSRQIAGTGLGLTITKALVELHGGKVWARSRLNQGSTFFFTLPMRMHLPAEDEPAAGTGMTSEDGPHAESPVR